jgi:hypothetical protein
MLLSKLKIYNNRIVLDVFKEEDHPRGGPPDNPGQFVKKGEGSSGKKSKEIQFSNIEDKIYSIFDKTAKKQNAPKDYKEKIKKQISLESAINNWEQTGQPNLIREFVKGYKNNDFSILKIGDYNNNITALQALNLWKASLEQDISQKELQRLISENDPLWDAKVGDKGELNLSSFTKVNFLKGEAAGTFKYKTGRKVIVFENPMKGLDIEDLSTRDKREREVILSGNYIVKEVNDKKIVLKRTK